MKREIKFRGKHWATNEWIYGDLLHNNSDILIIEKEKLKFREILISLNIMEYTVNEDTVEQFTELYDSKGNDIYEGDIVRFEYDSFNFNNPNLKKILIGVVTKDKYNNWEIGCNDNTPYILHCHIENAMKGEVIGNIHDNPELIKERKN